MPIKIATKGNTTVDVHLRPDTPVDPPALRPDITLRPGLEAETLTTPPRPGSTTGSADADAIGLAPTVTVHPTRSGQDSVDLGDRSLEHYRLSLTPSLPAANTEGLRLFKGRQYVELADGGLVQVGKESQSGLWRATLASELTPTGPAMLRNPDDGLWHAFEHSQPTTFALSATRLEDFRTALDFSSAIGDSDGLHRFEGKLYAVIDNHAYQVLQDLDASTPWSQVMRIVRAEDPVAVDADNHYVASRPGRSQAIVLDPSEGWVGVSTGGAGGMRRAERNPSARRSLAERFFAFTHRSSRPEARVRKLYPSFDDQQVAAFLRTLGDDVDGGLTTKETEYSNLEKDLQAWTATHKHLTVPSAQGPVTNWANTVANGIKRCWSQETTQLRFPLSHAPLPALRADFNHVRFLEMDSVAWSPAAETFLSGFSGLQSLKITRSGLEKLPAAVSQMHNLTELNLRTNKLQLDEASAAALGGLANLEVLVLTKNPLGKLPDFSAMPNLQELDLCATGIKGWPTGLKGLTALKKIDLRHNKLQEVPAEHLNPADDQFEAIVHINRHILLENNAFPADYWQKFERFWLQAEARKAEWAAGALEGAFRLKEGIGVIDRTRNLYAHLDVAGAKKFIMGLGDDTDAVLTRRSEAFAQLDTSLDAYKQSCALLSNAGQRKRALETATAIRQCWLDQTQTTLTLDYLGLVGISNKQTMLPDLSADFGHVRKLTLIGVEWSPAANTFLSGFSHLQHLSIGNSTLDKPPTMLSQMQTLTWLNLGSNQIELDAQAVATIAGLNRLTHLNLSHNPLKITPDVSAMSGLTTLNLSHAQISHWPLGLLNKTALTGVDLGSNLLTDVPEAHLNPPADQLAAVARINNVTLLTSNPGIPSSYVRKFEGYWRRLNTAHPELMTPVHPSAFDHDKSRAQRYHRLYPAKSINDCRKYLWGLEPGTVGTRLSQLEREFAVLNQQLDAWVFSGGGNRQGYIPANQLMLNAENRADRTTARDRIINCWRQETPQQTAFDGTSIGLELDLSGLNLPSLPDIDADFSHVGSVKLRDMHLSASPEGFLTRFRHVRWLDLSKNQLRVLPPAIGQMNGLTKLFLQHNEISLTVDTARILSERTTLRALWLSNNRQLGIVPDFSRIPDMRSVNLASTGISEFPVGLSAQPSLDTVNLSNNRIEQIPDFVFDAVPFQVNDVTNIRFNQLNNQSRARLVEYAGRLAAAGMFMSGRNNLIDTGLSMNMPNIRALLLDTMTRWTVGLPATEVATRRQQWQTVRDEQGSDGLFNTIDRLLSEPASHPDLQRRVWNLIDSITENTAQSEHLRREVLDRAGDPACCDRAAFTFTNLEVLTLAHKARSQARDEAQGKQLSALSKALFRLHEVDKIASADIAQREARIAASRTPEEARVFGPPRVPEEIEVRLFYRFRLKDRLQLPGQPERMGFARLADVSEAQLNAAYEKVIAQDNSPEEFQALVAREFWQEFITHKYRSQFETQRDPFQTRQATLDDAHSASELSFVDYKAQSMSLQAELAIKEAELITTLSRQELSEYAMQNSETAAVETE